MLTSSPSQILAGLRPFAKSSSWSAHVQLYGALFSLFLCLCSMMLVDFWMIDVLSWVVAFIFLMRLVIIQHDCGHGSFYSSTRANRIVGLLLSVCTTIPFGYWCVTHDIHHGNQSNLDARTKAEYPTYTVEEYRSLSKREKFRYRLTRSALGVCLIIPFLLLVGLYRFPNALARREGVHLEMLCLTFFLALIWFGSAYFGGTYVFVWIVSLQYVLMSVAFLFFYIQHQYEDAYWARKEDFDFIRAGLDGSGFLDVPSWAHWCTGSIGYHHIHHLCTSIPNYELSRAHDWCVSQGYVSSPMRFRDIPQTFRCSLWDTERKKLIPFHEIEE